ncbi:MAG TPA: Hsp70 family protein [Myxococcota bacterium]|nr:Hsp70 family protein [Myxococcota bacterium]
MAQIAIGIDLGTSNSCVAVSRHGRVDVLPNAFGESTTASVVNIAADGSITVGNAAKANIIHDPKHTISSAKRLIGRYFFSEEVKKARAICSYDIVEGDNHSVRIKVREEVFSLPEISAMVLREMKSIAEARLGQPVAKAVVTVPAFFNDNQRQATKDAARIAGLEVLRILNEPTAAALAYGFGRGLNQRVAVYDLGGGTFDISILEIGDDVFEVLATSGDTFLGGDDFDDRVIDLLAEQFMAKHKINLRNDRFALEKLKVAAEEAKKTLSIEPTAEIRIPDVATTPSGDTLSLEYTLSEREFNGLVADLMQRTFKVCDEALQQAGMVARDLDGVILVGGPTRLALVRNSVREYFQMEPRTDVDPDEVVAMGAAIHAASLLDQGSEAFLLDVTPLSLQIGVAGGLTEPVIERNTPVPIEQTRTFTTFNDFQESVSIRVYQGESRESSENEMLGHFEFGGFQKGRRGEVEIDVTFEINTDGIVNVTARDRATGEAASTRITLSSGLSESEISDIMDRGVADRVATATLESVGAAEPQDELIPVAQPTVPARKMPAQEKAAAPRPAPAPAPKPAAPARPAPAPAPAPKPVAAPKPAPAPAPKPVAAPAPVPAPIAEDDELVITAVELGEAPLIGSDGGELTDELELADLEGIEIEGQSDEDSLFDTAGTDLADDDES